MKWYTPNDTLSKHRLFNFEVGARGCGKTQGCIEYAVRQKLKNPKYEVVWLRRYRSETDKIITSFFDDVVSREVFKDCTFEIKGRKGYMNGSILFHFATLTVDGRVKGISSPNIRLLIFDEFLLDKNNVGARYLPKEVDLFLSLYDSVARPNNPNRERVPVLFLANAMSAVNPYFIEFKISFNETGKFKNKSITAQLIDSAEYTEQAKQSEFSQLISGSKYYEHSVNNTFMFDNYDFVCEKDAKAVCYCVIIFNSITYGVWINWEESRMFLSKKYDPSNHHKYTLSIGDYTPNTLTLRAFKTSAFYAMIRAAYNNSQFFFESIEVKDAFFKIQSLLKL